MNNKKFASACWKIVRTHLSVTVRNNKENEKLKKGKKSTPQYWKKYLNHTQIINWISVYKKMGGTHFLVKRKRRRFVHGYLIKYPCSSLGVMVHGFSIIISV